VTLNALSRAREQRFIRDFERAASAASRPLVLASAHRARGRSPPAPPPPGGRGRGQRGGGMLRRRRESARGSSLVN